MEQAIAHPLYTVEEYLKLEEQSDVKHEFIDGEIFAMAGGTERHSLISNNMGSELRRCLRGRPCRTNTGDFKIAISPFRFLYPDVSVFCGPTQFYPQNQLAGRNPILIVEVISESTEKFDRGQKFGMYRQIETFQEYVLISQDKALVEVYFKLDSNHWRFTTYEGLETVVKLESIDAEIPMQEIYLNVELPKETE